jgi:hypothetical protein
MLANSSPYGNLVTIRFEAIAELIQADKLFEDLSPPWHVLSCRHAKCHADHNFFILRYFQDALDPGFIEGADPAGPVTQPNGLKSESILFNRLSNIDETTGQTNKSYASALIL